MVPKNDRRLAAIMFTDIQGYTSLMQESETRALEVRKKHREIFQASTAEFNGELINYYGDGTLSIFSSVIKAVRCAIDMQKKFLMDPRIPVRIGIHLGDIITTEDDIIGDSVNLASRVESLAIVGSVLISDKVYEEIKNQDDLNVKDLGSFQFKNDRKTRNIYAIDAPGLVVPERHQLSGKIEEKRDSAGKKYPGKRSTIRFLGALFLIVILGGTGYKYFYGQYLTGQAEKKSIPQIELWKNEKQYKKTFELAMQVKEIIPDDPKLNELLASVSQPISIITNPPEAKVYRRLVGGDKNWEMAGMTPVDSLPMYKGESIWRIEKDGYEPVVRLSWQAIGDTLLLFEKGEISEEMVYIPESNQVLILPGLALNTRRQVPAFLMDRYEVSNVDFKKFIENGGYSQKEFWEYPFIKDGSEIPWEEAMTYFIDRTGQPGPAFWEVSDFPEGEDLLPVGGISWYEAAAYAAYAGKRLPTIFHFNVASTVYDGGLVIPYSNFSDKGPARQGEFQSIGGYGTYDLLGNMREWQHNETTSGNLRFILGGAWSDPLFAAQDAWAQDPFDRSAINGFRCIQYLDKSRMKDTLEVSVELLERSPRSLIPVNDEVFAGFVRQFDYDKTPLNIELNKLNIDNKDYRCEKAIIDAAYGNERFEIYCYVPTNGSPPYETVVLFPGAGALHTPTYDHRFAERVDFILKSGRALILPVYKSTFNRRDGVPDGFPRKSIFYKDHLIMWTKDYRRTIDYLETREDIDTDNIAFMGLSWGGITGGVIPAVEKRIKTVVLSVGGLTLQASLPEADQVNYLPRIKQPFLMLNGRYDFFFPYESSQVPMYDLLGTDPADKKHIISETTHFFPREEFIKETLAWMDKYLNEK